MTIVRVTVDELSKTPGQYRTIVDSDGQFCLVASTNKGTAVAEVKESGTVSFDNATVSSGQR